jgi:hypothetical protein
MLMAMFEQNNNEKWSVEQNIIIASQTGLTEEKVSKWNWD